MGNRICSFPDCGRPFYSNGLCCSHRRQQASGLALRPIRVNLPPEERFWRDVQRGSGESDCWTWAGRLNHNGYGVMTVNRRNMLAHRFAFELLVGPIPSNTEIDHRCHVPACCNPIHLRAVAHDLNHQNRKGAQSNSRSGVRGVSWDRDKGKWVVAANVRGRKFYGGWFSDLDAAARAAVELRRQVMTHNEVDRREPQDA